MQNFLYILLQWTAIFPYDFRDEAMISQVNALIRKINTFDQSLKPATEYIDKELRSKVSVRSEQRRNGSTNFIALAPIPERP